MEQWEIVNEQQMVCFAWFMLQKSQLARGVEELVWALNLQYLTIMINFVCVVIWGIVVAYEIFV